MKVFRQTYSWFSPDLWLSNLLRYLKFVNHLRAVDYFPEWPFSSLVFLRCRQSLDCCRFGNPIASPRCCIIFNTLMVIISIKIPPKKNFSRSLSQPRRRFFGFCENFIIASIFRSSAVVVLRQCFLCLPHVS